MASKDRLASQLVPERVATTVRLEETAGEGVLGGRLVDDARQQHGIDGWPDDRRRLERCPSDIGQPRRARKDGVSNGRRDSVRGRRDDLRDVERIAARLPVQVLRVELRAARQLADRVDRQGAEREAPHGRRRREVADDDAQRMLAADLIVAVGPDHERARGLDAPPDEAQGVERRLVRPVQVVEEEDHAAGSRAQRTQERAQHGVPRRLRRG